MPNATKSTKSTKTSRAKKAASPDVKLSSFYVTVGAAKGIDSTRAAKLVRSRLRSNFDAVTKADPRITKAKSSANDGNRWPESITRDALIAAGYPESMFK